VRIDRDQVGGVHGQSQAGVRTGAGSTL